MYRLKDDLAPNLAAYVQKVAGRAIEAILAGNEDEMRKRLSCREGSWTGRSDSPYATSRDDFHPVIHGKLFEQGAIALRRNIVAAHRDLIETQRILDLEDQIKSLTVQVNKLEREKRDQWERVRNYLSETKGTTL